MLSSIFRTVLDLFAQKVATGLIITKLTATVALLLPQTMSIKLLFSGALAQAVRFGFSPSACNSLTGLGPKEAPTVEAWQEARARCMMK